MRRPTVKEPRVCGKRGTSYEVRPFVEKGEADLPGSGADLPGSGADLAGRGSRVASYER